MKFQVIRKSDNMPMMGTDYVSCVPFDQIDSMNELYYFRVLGKKMNSGQVKNAFRSRYPVAVKGIAIQSVGTIPDDLLSAPGKVVPETVNEEEQEHRAAKAKAQGKPVATLKEKSTPKPTSQPAGKASKKVRCVDTGEVFDTQSAAAKHFKIDPAQVSDSIKTGRPRSGYTFEKVIG